MIKHTQTGSAVDVGSNRLLGYERLTEIHDRIITKPGESVLQRRPFRWLLNGSPLQNAYESFAPESICRDHNLKIIHRFNDDLMVVVKVA